jgi:hypothetical protein
MISEEILGKRRSFVLGTKTFKYLHELTGIATINEVFERLVNKRKIIAEDGDVKFSEEPLVTEIEHLDFMAKTFYCLAKTGSELNDEPVDFNEIKTTHWIDIIGYTRASEIILQSVEAYTEKNRIAPMTGQTKAA